MPTQHPSKAKVCRVCSEDCSDRPRTKDRAGNYYCKGCYEQATQKKKQVKAPKPVPPPLADAQDDSLGLLSDLAAHQASAPPNEANADTCEHCNEPLPKGAALCMNCGFNRQTGQRVLAAASPTAKAPRGGGGASNAMEMLKQPWVAFAVPMVVLGALFMVAQSDPEAALLFLGPQAIFALVVTILVLIRAFGEGVGTGFLTLCLPFYVLYYVFSVNESPHLKALYGATILTTVAVFFVPGFDLQPEF